MQEKNRIIYSLIFKFAIIVCVIVGFVLTYLFGHINGVTSLLYFTIQSNIWLAIIDLVLSIVMIKALIKNNYLIDHRFYIAHQIFTVCITITGLVFLCVLVPGFYLSKEALPEGYHVFNAAAVLLHIVVPSFAILDFILFTKTNPFNKKNCFYVAIPTGYYFIFSLIGFFSNWDFGDGRNFPYFFLNYDSPAGLFGFSDVMPYFMGSFYWIIIIVILAFGLSYLFIKIINHRLNKMKINY